MKKQDDLHMTFRTTIKDISPLGSALSDTQRFPEGDKTQ